MAVLHHAFKCPITPAIERELLDILRIWQAGDREQISHLSKDGYEALTSRQDIHAAFHLDPGGAVPSWLQPKFISPGLAAFVMLSRYFELLSSLSAHNDTNHALLARHLPALGWTVEDVASLINGQPIEAMLRDHAGSADDIIAGGFSHTGGWTAPDVAGKLGAKLETLVAEPPSATDKKAYEAWNALTQASALEDAVTMLEPLHSSDWLVMSTTH